MFEAKISTIELNFEGSFICRVDMGTSVECIMPKTKRRRENENRKEKIVSIAQEIYS